ncbi:MAG: Na+/H+ antiporter NhaC family protein [Candidatus Cryptobacteroides sp.]
MATLDSGNISGHLKGLFALSPMLVLLAVYLLTSILAGDFYGVPICVSFVVAAVYSIFVLPGIPFSDRVKTFSSGAADSNIMYMIWIFVLAGIFASSAKAVGAVDATVALTMHLVPGRFLPAGIFVAACFISMSVGTSVGTIVALAPVAAGLSEEMGIDLALMISIVVGGAFFGDNLSFISDTTIAATQSQGCRMKDKFKTNLMIVLPAAIVTLAIYLFSGISMDYDYDIPSVPFYLAIPYLAVIVCALFGMNVLKVLVNGILLTAILGLIFGVKPLSLFQAAGSGVQSMCELILVTLLAGGIMNIIRTAGGFDYLIDRMTRKIGNRRGGESIIALLTAITNLCTANNTIAIITVGGIAKDISSRFGISPRRTASLMDTASCFVQGLLPYGAQILMASGLSGLSPFEIIPHLYYPMLIGVMVVIAIIFQFPRR